MQHSLTSHSVMQSVYSAIPYALSPVLGNPLAMAAVNVDRTASLPTQVHLPLTAPPVSATASIATFLLNIYGNCKITDCCHARMESHYTNCHASQQQACDPA